jgi:hypothetical protein
MAPRPDLAELGSTGIVRAGGFVLDEFLTALRGRGGRKILREMAENEPIIASYLFAIEKILMRLDWHFEPWIDPNETAAEDEGPSDEDLANAKFADSCLNDMSTSWDGTLSEILSMLTFGWSYHEIVYKRRVGPDQKDGSKRSKFTDGKIGWRRWGVRAQESLQHWDLDPDDGSVTAMRQLDPAADGKGLCIIPIEKALLFRTTIRKNNPEGRPLIRSSYVPWYYKKVIQEIEAIGIERDLAGLPVAWLHPMYFSESASDEEKAVLAAVTDIVKTVKRNEMDGLVFPLQYDESGHKMMDFTLMASAGNRQIDIDKTIARHNQAMAMAVLADFILLGHERVGSFALGASKIDLWTMAVDSIANSIAEVVNSHAVPRLFALNGLPTDRLPQLVYGDVGHIDLTEIADYIQKLGGAGALAPDDKLEDHLREIAGLPPADQEARDQRHEQAEAMAEMAVQAAENPEPVKPGGGADGGPPAKGPTAPGKAAPKP